MKIEIKNGWRKYSPNKFFEKGSECFWQKLIKEIEYEKIFADIIEWLIDGKPSYALKIQIPDRISITGMTINVEVFNYGKLDFNEIEKDAKKVIDKLTKQL